MTRRDERGQATVEFALIIPLVLVVLLGVVQVTTVAYAQLQMTHAAREAARALSVDPAAELSSLIDSTGADFDVTVMPTAGRNQGVIHVVAHQDVVVVSPLFGSLLDGRRVRSEAQMAIE